MKKESKFDAERVFEEFSDKERKEVRELWETSKTVDSEKPEIRSDEVEKALSSVHKQIDDTTGTGSNSWKWLAAAAVIFLIFGAGILFIPRTVTAPHGEFATANLPDGSTVELNSGSELQYGWLFGITNRSVSIDGEGYFTVRKSEDPFIVAANGATVRVTGTEFNLRSWSANPGAETMVAVAEGSVEFYPGGKSNKAVVLSAGQSSQWMRAMETPTPPEKVRLERVSGWREHKLIFDREPLTVIFQELERRFNTKITLDAAKMSAETLTTYYSDSNKDIESILKDICRVKGLRFAPTANGYRVYE